MNARWILVAYQTPAAPSTARVSAWRGLHGLGALYLGPSVCVLPASVAEAAQLEAIAGRVRAAGGTFDVLAVEAFAPEAESVLRERFNEARALEFAEVVERAEAILAELERELAGGKVSFAEVEENETGVTKIRQWLRRVSARDLFGCPARAQAEAALRLAEEHLARFTELAVSRESTSASPSVAEPTLRVAGGDE